MIAVSLNVGDGVRLIKPAKLCMCTQKYYKHNEDGRTATGVCGNGSVPLSHSGNVVTRIGTHTQDKQYGTSGLVDRIFSVHAESRDFDFHRRQMFERFFPDPIYQNIRSQCAMSWTKVVSEWRSVIALSLNIGCGVGLISNWQNRTCARKTEFTVEGAGYAQPWFRTAEPRGKRRYENWKTTTDNQSNHR